MVPVRRLDEDVEIAAVGRRPPHTLVRLGRVRRRSPGVDVRLDRALGPCLAGGAEPKSVGQDRGLQVGQVALVELRPVAGVPERRRVGLVSMSRPPRQSEGVSRDRCDGPLEVGGDRAVPADHLVHQRGVVRVDLIREVGAGDLARRAVAPPHPVRQVGPAPRHQPLPREPQPAPPGVALGGVPLPPVPGQLTEGRVAVHQVGARRSDPLSQPLHQLYVRGRHPFGGTHAVPLWQDR